MCIDHNPIQKYFVDKNLKQWSFMHKQKRFYL